ncbi:alpha/beta hydrolase [Candidatus Riflebacteria bacterium]
MIEKITLQSRILNTFHQAIVYIPDAFCHISSNLPVLYLFRGKSEEWFEKPEERGGRALFYVVEDLISKGYMQPLAIVCPDICDENGKIFSCGFDLKALLDRDIPGIGSGNFRDFFIAEFFPWIENKFSFAGKAHLRAIGGFSLGSLTAFSLAFTRPELFSVLSSYDGSFLFWYYDHPEGTGPQENDLRLDLFPYWFGLPPDLEHFRRHNPFDILYWADGDEAKAIARLKIFQHCANETHITANNWREARMAQILKDYGMDNQFKSLCLHPNAKHNWYWVDEHLYRLLPPLSKILNQ